MRELKQFEKKLSNRNYRKMEDFFLRFRKKIEKDNSVKFMSDEVIIAYDWFDSELNIVLTEILKYNVTRTITKYSDVFKWKISAKITKSVKSKILSAWNDKYSAEKVKNISDTTRKRLNTVLTNSHDKGLGFEATTRAILQNVDDMRIGRAQTIARTETSMAINNTALIEAEEVGMEEKGWIHIGGKYTSRENHKRLNGTWIPLNEKFNLGNYKVDMPHDPILPAGEVVNCNCLIIFR